MGDVVVSSCMQRKEKDERHAAVLAKAIADCGSMRHAYVHSM